MTKQTGASKRATVKKKAPTAAALRAEVADLKRKLADLQAKPKAKRAPRRNPVPRSSVAQAAKAFTAFTGHQAEVIGKMEKPVIPDVVWPLGEMIGVSYAAVRDGQREEYYHEFKENCRPLLCVSPDGKQLLVLGGRYKVGETGINDKG
ncbi:hypothetical protein [Leeia sp.]|uniref:hypothetical protein n=1 Tax=Leeia sp. TaxID=2884678 RepID=UPI0035AFE576